MSFQKITIVGNIGKDFSLNNVNGKNVLNGSVAVTKNYLDKNGQKQSLTEWFSISKWSDRDMSSLLRYLLKGTMVLITGEISVKSYQNKQGETSYQLNVIADEIKLLSAKPQSQPQQPAPQSDLTPSQQEFLAGGVEVDEAPF